MNKFYVCEKYYLLIYETKQASDKALAATTLAADRSGLLAQGAAFAASASLTAAGGVSLGDHWSEKLKSKVLYSNPREPIFVIKKEEERFWNVIIGEKIGWIIVQNWLEIKELKQGFENVK